MFIQWDESICAVCRTEGMHPFIGAWKAEGHWGLDGRAPDPMASMLNFKTQHCPNCGYSADDISVAPPGVSEIVDSQTYQIVLAQTDIPFACKPAMLNAHLLASLGKLDDAILAYARVAWLADDEGDVHLADKYRLIAANLARQVNVEDGHLGDHGMSHQLRCDLLRQAGYFKEARASALLGLDSEPDNDLSIVLNYELELIAMNDCTHKNFGDALAANELKTVSLSFL